MLILHKGVRPVNINILFFLIVSVFDILVSVEDTLLCLHKEMFVARVLCNSLDMLKSQRRLFVKYFLFCS